MFCNSDVVVTVLAILKLLFYRRCGCKYLWYVYCTLQALLLAVTTLSHTSNDIVQCVVFTPLFATLPPTHYIVHCDTMNFFNLLLLFSIYFGAPVRGWGFAFRAWVRDIENRDCLYKNPYSSK
nr:MAG TPA: hypothetical protein [Caudoviricetes sp.]